MLPNELSIAGISQLLADDTYEVARLWVTNHGPSTILVNPSVLDDPFAYGVLIADLVRHGARAYAIQTDDEEADVLAAIRAGLDADLALTDVEMLTANPGGSVN